MRLHDDAAVNRTRQPGHRGFADPDDAGNAGFDGGLPGLRIETWATRH